MLVGSLGLGRDLNPRLAPQTMYSGRLNRSTRVDGLDHLLSLIVAASLAASKSVARPTPPTPPLLLQTKSVDQGRERGWMLAPARVVQEESRKWRTPVLEHSY
jgi:hypothetical protein